MSVQVVRVTDTTTRAELAECLTHMCAYAKRQQYVTAKFNSDAPTPWDLAHRRMDGPLDDWLTAKS